MKYLKRFENWKFPFVTFNDSMNLCCDYCGYKEPISLKNMNSEDADNLLGKRCPKCEMVMVNEKDVKKLKFILKRFKIDEIPTSHLSYQTPRHDRNESGKIKFKK